MTMILGLNAISVTRLPRFSARKPSPRIMGEYFARVPCLVGPEARRSGVQSSVPVKEPEKRLTVIKNSPLEALFERELPRYNNNTPITVGQVLDTFYASRSRGEKAPAPKTIGEMLELEPLWVGINGINENGKSRFRKAVIRLVKMKILWSRKSEKGLQYWFSIPRGEAWMQERASC